MKTRLRLIKSSAHIRCCPSKIIPGLSLSSECLLKATSIVHSINPSYLLFGSSIIVTLSEGRYNIDVVNTIMYQPMAMCGRFDKEKLHEMRITSSHIAKQLLDYTDGGYGKVYPLPTISEFIKFPVLIKSPDSATIITILSMIHQKLSL